MSNEVVKTSQINIEVGLDKDKLPIRLAWKATEGDTDRPAEECKAFLLSIFDRQNKDTLRIDLWTNDMQVMEMDRFFYQTLRSLADTYFRATQNQQMATEMQKFVQYFGEQTEVLPKP